MSLVRIGCGEESQSRRSTARKGSPGPQSDQVRELKQLHEENARLMKPVAELRLDRAKLQDSKSKNGPACAVCNHYGEPP
jgi:hypothetical protein